MKQKWIPYDPHKMPADNAFLKIKVGNKEEVVKGIKQQYDLKTPTKNRQ
jgi:hypothetical protein